MDNHFKFNSTFYQLLTALFLSILAGCGGGGGGGGAEEPSQVSIGGKVVNLDGTMNILFEKNNTPWESTLVTGTGQDVFFNFIEAHDTGANFKILFDVPLNSTQICEITAGGGGTLSPSTAKETVITCTDVVPKVGVFLDSEVKYIAYSTETQEGFTNSEGEFLYFAGETVTFKLGATELPPTIGKSIITPLDLASADSVDDPKVINMVRLLMSLDTNGDPSDGLYIDNALSANPYVIDFTLPIDQFAAAPAIADILLMANLHQNRTELVSVEDAKNHLRQTLIENGLMPNPTDTCAEDLVFSLRGHEIITQTDPLINTQLAGKYQINYLRGTLTITPTLECTLAVNEGYSGSCFFDGVSFSAFNGAMTGTLSTRQSTLLVKNHSAGGEDVAANLQGAAMNSCSTPAISDGSYTISGIEAVLATNLEQLTPYGHPTISYEKYPVTGVLTISNGKCSVTSSEGDYDCLITGQKFQGLGDAHFLQGTITQQSVSYYLLFNSNEIIDENGVRVGVDSFYGQYYGTRN